MTHQCSADTLALIRVDYSKSDLGLPWLMDDIPCATDDHGFAAFFNHGDQGDVTDEVIAEETAIEGLCAKGGVAPLSIRLWPSPGAGESQLEGLARPQI